MTYQEAKRQFVKTLQKLATYRRASDVFFDWLTCAKLALQNTVETKPKLHEEREAEFAEIYAKYKKEEQVEFPRLLALLCQGLEDCYGDFLGEVYMEANFGNDKAGQFFTPYHVSKMLAFANFDQIKIKEWIDDNGCVTVEEPSCGSGGTVVAFLEKMREEGFNYQTQCFVSCTDLDPRCAYMAYITLSVLGVPAEVYHGNTLSREVFEVLHTPALCMQWLKFRRKVGKLRKPAN